VNEQRGSIISEITMKKSAAFDTWIILLLALLLIVPALKMFTFKIAGINILFPQLVHVAIIFCCICLAFVRRVRSRELLFAFLLCAFLAIAILVKVSTGKVPVFGSMKHLSIFSAYFAAVACLLVPIRYDLARLQQILIAALLCGLALSLILYWMFPNYLAEIRDTATAESTIRLMWENGAAIFVLIPALFLIRNGTLRVLIICFIAIGLLFVMNRTIIAGIVFYFLLLLFVRRSYISQTKILYLSAGFILTIIIFSIVIITYPEIGTTFMSRFFDKESLMMAGETRLPLYEQYFANIMKSFPWGLGLGIPVASLWGHDAYYSDVSLLTFLIPLGLAGLCFCLAFIILLYRRISQLNDSYWRGLMSISVITYVFVSLNVDIFSRNNAVIILAAVVSVLIERDKCLRKINLQLQNRPNIIDIQKNIKKPRLPEGLSTGSAI